MSGITVDLRDFKRLTADLEKISKVAVPYGIRNGLNAVAFAARRSWQEVIGEKFILRNTWMTRRLLVDKASGSSVGGMRAVLTTPDEYLEKQEFSGTSDHVVPTGIATGEGRGANPRRRLVRKPNRVSTITLGTRVRGASGRQRNAIAVRMAAASGSPFVYLNLGKTKGIFRVSGGKRAPKLDLVWDTRSRSHHIRALPTLGPAVVRIEPRASALMTSSLIDQLKRNKVFGY